ncbi:MAG: integrase [Myxococcales bacterium]|nr:integrase [Myxococcales bacterium]
MSPNSFESSLGPTILRHVTLKAALGRHYDSERWNLAHLDRFLAAHGGTELTVTTFAAWCRTFTHLKSGVRRARMQAARKLCLYRRRTEPGCFVPDATQFPALHQRLRPHIFTEDEVVRVLKAAEGLEPSYNSPLHREVFRLAVVLLYTTGLRRRELIRLTIADWDPVERTLLVRTSKFYKSRLVPLSKDASSELIAYLAILAGHVPLLADTPLLWHRSAQGRAYSGGGMGDALRRLFRAAGVQNDAGGPPRTHDLRHTFAVHALLRWYRAGDDVQAKLPYLSTFMGHVSIDSTRYYLHFVQPLADAASKRFADHCGALVVVAPTTGAAS